MFCKDTLNSCTGFLIPVWLWVLGIAAPQNYKKNLWILNSFIPGLWCIQLCQAQGATIMSELEKPHRRQAQVSNHLCKQMLMIYGDVHFIVAWKQVYSFCWFWTGVFMLIINLGAFTRLHGLCIVVLLLIVTENCDCWLAKDYQAVPLALQCAIGS